ncbi:serine/threonine protein kinase [Richelia sinica FACHB-800]|uniref:Serine/threonine protein kinase n=1 Tax=Richelia sinica FACHB-800 TaxID=1357546 RepID=A0A975T7E4_9NOST|nr:serine/threonine-protein kinase [Richelia sinica]MBD2663619.1 GUN4 domain-containing protein [Richelia sinica FACHB-800]QXE22823.1 serine/threonine protein kinase [Richelia sinica FACHB-800]
MYWNTGHRLHNDKYIIQEILGQGAFGITYQAIQDTPLQLPVVIKTPNMQLKRDRQYSRYVEKFIQEAKLLGKLCQVPHQNIVRVLDYFEEGDSNTPCLVMEFIDGTSLFDLIENAGQPAKLLPEKDAVNCLYQIGDALKSIHQNSIVHRDIHPGNIMLRGGNQPILIDFGLAGGIAPAKSFSKKFGNENFAPYEQMKGSKEITVDIYGFAATLYYAVTGEYPTTSWDRKYHDAKLIAPKQHNPNISDNLNQAILAGMELEAQDRPQTIQAWLNLLNGETDIQDIDDLSSEKGIDYRKLRDLLAAGNWKDADYKTYVVMLQAIGREKGDWIREEEFLNFPCTDLRTLDRLWVKYSNGKFGFSVQKQIYLESGGKPDGKYDKEAWEKFADLVGWRKEAVWISSYDEFILSTKSYPKGYLPNLVYGVGLVVLGGFLKFNWVILSHRSL